MPTEYPDDVLEWAAHPDLYNLLLHVIEEHREGDALDMAILIAREDQAGDIPIARYRAARKMLEAGLANATVYNRSNLPRGHVTIMANGLRTPKSQLVREEKLQERNNKIYELYDAGYTYAEVGERVGVNKTTVGKVLRQRREQRASA